MLKASKEIVQHQGWLLKRGEGYEDEDVVQSILNPTATTTSTSAFNKSRSKSTTNKSKDSQQAEDVITDILGKFRGKAEKKRFFRLVSIEERLPSNTESSLPRITSSALRSSSNIRSSVRELANQSVELRYYLDEKCENLKGVIVLTPDCELITTMDDGSLTLQTPGRKYFLRPADSGLVNSVTSRTVSVQWANAIRKEIRLLFQFKQVLKQQQSFLHKTSSVSSMMPSSSPALSSTNTNARLIRGESTLFVEEHIPENLMEILSNPKNRKEFHEFLESALAVENLLFYQAVDKLTANSTQQEFVNIMNNFVRPGSPNEVNVSGSQRNALLKLKTYKIEDFEDSKQEIFKLMETNFFKRFHREAIEKTGAFAALYATLGLDGYNVVLSHFGPVKTDLERMHFAMKCKLKRAEDVIGSIKKEISSSSRDIAVTGEPTSRSALVATYHSTIIRLDALMVYVEEVSTQVITPLETLQTKIETDLKTIHNSVQEQLTDLENCKKLVINKKNGMDSQLSLEDLENALEQLEDLHSKPMESAMSKLESLELYRIETAREIMLYAVMAEKNLYDDITKAVEVMQSTLKNIDVNRDVKELTVLFGHDLARNEMF